MTVVDLPDNGQDEVVRYAVAGHDRDVARAVLNQSRQRGGVSDVQVLHLLRIGYTAGLASGRAGAGEQPRELARQWQGLASSADIVRNVAGTDYVRGHMSGAASALRRCADELLALLGGPQPDGEAEPCPVYSHGTDGWHCAVTGDHDQHTNAAGDVTW